MRPLVIDSTRSGRAYYNEHDGYAADWLRNLIAAGLIMPGDVDTRSIVDVRSADVAGYERCHFFAGIGGWDYALGLAGWPAGRRVWTGSCPCPPFSAAGKGQQCPECGSPRNLCHPRKTGHFVCLHCGCDRHADDRHLYPEFARLIRECRPARVYGEQVASTDGRLWLAAVRADLEAMGYGVGAADLCAAGVGAPHIRQRLWFCATTEWGAPGHIAGAKRREYDRPQPITLADAGRERCDREPSRIRRPAPCGRHAPHHLEAAGCGQDGDVANAAGERSHGLEAIAECGGLAWPEGGRQLGDAVGAGLPVGSVGADERGTVRDEGATARSAGPLRDPWCRAERIECSDGRWRPAEPGPQQMADGSADRVGRVRPDAVAQAEQDVDGWAIRHSADAGEALRDLWRTLSEGALRDGTAGRPWGLFEAPVLLAFLRQLTEQRWRFASALTCARSPSSRIVLRALHLDREAARAPCGRGLDEQRSRQSSDALRDLSQIVACNAESAWSEACRAYAVRGFPLAHGAPARVGRLRAYGNAIVPQVAAAFIAASLDTLPSPSAHRPDAGGL